MIGTYLTEALFQCEAILSDRDEKSLEWQEICQKISRILQGMGLFEASSWWHALGLENQFNSSQIYCGLGELYGYLQQWQPAIASYEKALSLQSDRTEAYENLTLIYRQLGHTEKAVELGYQAFQLNPDRLTAQNRYKLGKALLKQGKLNEAIACHQSAIEQDPTFCAAYYDLAESFIARKEWKKAEDYYRQLLERDPNQTQASYQLGMLWVKQNQLEGAIAQFRHATQLNPNFIKAYRELVKLLVRLGQWDDAIATCQTLIAAAKEYPWVYIYLGNALAKQGQLAEATVSFRKACELKGWHLCRTKNYDFTQDNLIPKIPVWQTHLQPFAHQAEVQAMEIGSLEGMSACWLLDNILTHRSAQLTCVEKTFSEPFLSNIAKTGAAEKVKTLQGKPLKLLADLEPNTYDLVNVQDRGKKANRIQETIELSWQALKVGGLLILSDYQSRNPARARPENQIGIDAFLKSVRDKISILHQSNQLIVQKITS
jgi:tetratricopeptide (TPR) repeat protein